MGMLANWMIAWREQGILLPGCSFSILKIVGDDTSLIFECELGTHPYCIGLYNHNLKMIVAE